MCLVGSLQLILKVEVRHCLVKVVKYFSGSRMEEQISINKVKLGQLARLNSFPLKLKDVSERRGIFVYSFDEFLLCFVFNSQVGESKNGHLLNLLNGLVVSLIEGVKLSAKVINNQLEAWRVDDASPVAKDEEVLFKFDAVSFAVCLELVFEFSHSCSDVLNFFGFDSYSLIESLAVIVRIVESHLNVNLFCN